MFNANLTIDELNKFSLSYLKNSDNLELYLSKLEDIDINKAKEFVKTLFNSSINISNLKVIFRFIATRSWEKYRIDNIDIYYNNFNKTMSILNNSTSFDVVIKSLKYLDKYKELFGSDKYNYFIGLLENYYNNKKKDEISLCLASFSSKSKEDYISNYVDMLLSTYKQFFKLKFGNKRVIDKIIEEKQKEIFRNLYLNNSINDEINVIKNKYFSYTNKLNVDHDTMEIIINKIISMFILSDASKIEDIFDVIPLRYYEFLNYEEALKIINRLNLGYITYDSMEVDKYRQLIGYDNNNYYYSGNLFNKEEIKQINKYKFFDYLFKKIRTDIMKITKNIPVVITKDDLITSKENSEFNDLYYEFDSSYLEQVELIFLHNYLVNLNNNNHDYLFKWNLVQLELVNSMSMLKVHDEKQMSIFGEIYNYGISCSNLTDLMINYNIIKDIMANKFSLENIFKIFNLNDVFKDGSLLSYSMLGIDVLNKMINSSSMCVSTAKKRIQVACDLASVMYKRNYSSVCYVNGIVGNYKYSMYDNCDNSILTAGIDTGTCLKLTGTQNDLLHYVILNENGFILKITDLDDNLVARVAGFRNGNVIYLNQLSTIYDKSDTQNKTEIKEIYNVLNIACLDIINKSRDNIYDSVKIDYVILNKTDNISDMRSNIDTNLVEEIALKAISFNSNSWKEFVTNKNLSVSSYDIITTNFGTVDLICLNSNEFDINKVKYGDVGKIYKRVRNNVSNSSINTEVEGKINKIIAIFAYQKNIKFTYATYPSFYKALIGDNWYIVYNENKVIDSLCLDDELAIIEYNQWYNKIDNNKRKR